MLIVISNPVQIDNEAEYINKLFDEGLLYFHLRKPDYTELELAGLLNEIDRKYYSRIALHQHHQLSNNFEIKRLHFTEKNRQETDLQMLNKLLKKGFTLSTSIHDLKTYGTLDNLFSYCLVGPVFNSISKSGYLANPDVITQMASFKEKSIKKPKPLSIAIGGIDKSRISTIKEKAFDGLALLGTIWNEPAQSVNSFKEIQQLWM